MDLDSDHIPLVTPTPPEVSNFANPSTLRPMLITVSTVCLSVMIPFAALRTYSKIRIVRSFGWDDGMATDELCFPF